MNGSGHNRIGFFSWIHRELIQKKFISPLGLTILSVVAVVTAVLAANGLALLVFAAAGGIIAVAIVYCCLFKPLYGYYITTLIAYFAFYPDHILNIGLPISTVVEVLILFLFLGTVWFTK